MKLTCSFQSAEELNVVHGYNVVTSQFVTRNDEEAGKELAKAIKDEIDREIILELIKMFPPENEDDEFESLVSIAKNKD